MSVEQTAATETLEVKIQPTVYVQVVMPSGVIQVFERPIYAEVAAVGPQGASGPPGVDGADGPPGQSAILGVWYGQWLNTVVYPSASQPGGPAMVQHLGSTYLQAGLFNTTEPPNAEIPPASPWELVAAKGDEPAPFRYIHDQLTPSAVWIVVHLLFGFPNVTTIDSAGSEIVGDLLYIDNTTLQVTFASATAGKAYVS